jgi:adenosylcobinamide-phosphate synthase
MSFLSALFALLLEQARPLGPGNVIHAAMRSWVRWCCRNFDAGKTSHAALTWGFAVLAPSMGALLIYWLLVWWAGWPLAILWSALILYTCLGFRQFSFHFTQIRDALLVDDEVLARKNLALWQRVPVSPGTRSELIGQVLEASVQASHRHVFGVLAWFSVLAAFGLGPMGAVIYRLSEFVLRYWQHQSEQHHQPVSVALRDKAKTNWYWVDWIPSRITAFGFAVVGNFEEAVDGWRRCAEQGQLDNDGVLLAASAGAMNVCLPSVESTLMQRGISGQETAQRPKPELAHLAIVVGLVWRTVVMWIVLLALLTMARLLG